MFVYHKEEFIDHFQQFLGELEPRYVEYFVTLCSEYAPHLSKEEVKAIGLSLYKSLAQNEFALDESFRDSLIKMRNDGVVMGFMINRNMFFILENYLAYVKEEELTSQIDLLMMHMSRFMNALENEISTKISEASRSAEMQFNTLKSANNVIIEGFQTIKESSGKVQFYNLYQGIPISCQAEIVSVQDDSATFRLELLQEIAMKLDGQAFILKNDVFPKHIKADIVYSNFLTKTVMLENFTYLLNMPALERSTPRIHPDIVAEVYLQPEGSLVTTGRLFDLSVNGLGVLSSENNGIEIGTRLLVSFSLPFTEEIEIPATVVNIITYQSGFRFCMRIFPNEEIKDKIAVYSEQREKDIIQNLEDELKDYIF